MMQKFGLEDLSHMQSRRNLLKYLVRVEMASDWFTRIYRSILAEQISSKMRALLEPAIMMTSREDKEHERQGLVRGLSGTGGTGLGFWEILGVVRRRV